MYKFSYFTEEDNDKVIDFIKENPFAIITGFGDPYPVASHIPLEVEIINGQLFLSGHLMKNTDHHKAFMQNDNVLVIFTGPHCFVSANWYPNPAGGSTWNYMTVHAKGKIKFTGEEGAYKAVQDITKKYVGENTPASFDQLTPEYISKMTKAIVGFTIEVESIDNVFKLSQNHDEATRKNIIAKLKERGDANSIQVAAAMENITSKKSTD
jgi:transcriptional regulator